MAGRQFIYHMRGLNKTYPGGKKVLENIQPLLLPRCENRRARRQRLRQIHPAQDHGRDGQGLDRRGWVAEGATVGYLPQEPKLDETLDVRGNVMLGVAKQKAIMDRYNELMSKLLRRNGGGGREASGHHRRGEPVGSRQQGRAGHGCAALPAG